MSFSGGISYFSGTKGLVCDNVDNYEVVLASGEVVNANREENRDLWTALKGGAGNFSIVTRFDLRTWRQGPLYGGVVVSSLETMDSQLEAFAALATDFDPHVAIILSASWSRAQQASFVFCNMMYTADGVEDPLVLRPFTQVQPQFLNTMRVASLREFAIETSRHAVVDTR